jgi:hypothetical protein
MLCPIALFVDKTHTDAQGRLCQEPALLTLGAFNRATRPLPQAWWQLGHAPNRPLSDCHVVPKHVLKRIAKWLITREDENLCEVLKVKTELASLVLCEGHPIPCGSRKLAPSVKVVFLQISCNFANAK